MPNPKPQRAENPRHLDPAGVRLERALIARARTLANEAGRLGTLPDEERGGESPAVLYRISAEFSALAQELHYW